MNEVVIETSEAVKRYAMLVFGCQMNVRDSELIAGMLEAEGYQRTEAVETADLVILNTCSVRHSAENKVYGKLGELNVIRRTHPNMLIGVSGCMAQLEPARRRLRKAGVDLVFGTHNLHELPALLDRLSREKKPVYDVWDQAGEVVEGLPDKRPPGITAFVNIMYGCNNFCSYCIVPYVRGRERSREPLHVVEECRRLVDGGVREITLLGQNVNSYGRGLDESVDFADLLEKVNGISGIERIRFMTSHPRDMSRRLIEAVAGLNHVCEHIHAPLQSGSDRILKLMNRGYTQAYYYDIVDTMRSLIPGVAVTTDLIVGFPGETETDFEDTLGVVEQVRFDAAFTFMYSQRSGTKACELPDQLERDVINRRLVRLNEVQYQIAAEENARLAGRTVEVLVEGTSKTNTNRLSGRTRTNRIVVFDAPEAYIGRLVPVKVTEAKTFTLFGELALMNLEN